MYQASALLRCASLRLRPTGSALQKPFVTFHTVRVRSKYCQRSQSILRRKHLYVYNLPALLQTNASTVAIPHTKLMLCFTLSTETFYTTTDLEYNSTIIAWVHACVRAEGTTVGSIVNSDRKSGHFFWRVLSICTVHIININTVHIHVISGSTVVRTSYIGMTGKKMAANRKGIGPTTLKRACNSTTNTRTKYLLVVMHKTLCSIWLTFIRRENETDQNCPIVLKNSSSSSSYYYS